MKKFRYLLSFLIFFQCLLGFFSLAAMAQIARTNQKLVYTIEADRSVVVDQTLETTPLSTSSIQAFSQMRLPVSGNQKLEILDVYTRKADGRRVDISDSDIVTQNGAVGPQMSFIDLKLKQINFRDVAVGDTIVAKIRYHETAHYFPDHYSASFALQSNGIERSLEITLHHPESVKIKTSHSQFEYSQTKNGEIITQVWSGKAYFPAISEANPANIFTHSPYVSFSTFDSFEEIGVLYAKAASEKMKPTAAIRDLAKEITKDSKNRREEAVAIFDWVTKNIRYVAVYLGNGRFVPNDAELILSRRYGDCKDHETLFASLLAARDIKSEPTLIHNLPIYDELPVTAEAFNHVITYLPEFDRFVDSTSSFSTFDRLPSEDGGKFVVIASAESARIGRTPKSGISDNKVHLVSHIVLAADGKLSGETIVTAQGEFAQMLRAFSANAEGKSSQSALEGIARSLNFVGSSTLQSTSATDHREPFELRTTWDFDKKVPLKGSPWSVPHGLSPIWANVTFLVPIVRAKRKFDVQCRSGRIEQSVDVKLPEGLSVRQLPPRVFLQVEGLTTSKVWTMQDDQLHVETILAYESDRPVCGPSQIEAIEKEVSQINRKLNANLTFIEKTESPIKALNSGDSGVREFQIDRTVRMAARTRIGTSYALEKDCSSLGVPVSTIIRGPQHGEFESVVAPGYPNYAKSDLRAHCNDNKQEMEVLYFTSAQEFTGQDSVLIETHYPSGIVTRREFRLEIR